MLKTGQFAVALVESRNDQWYVTGLTSDIQRLSNAGAVARAWEIKLDNGHRPYAVLKKRINFELVSPVADTPKNTLTVTIGNALNLEFTGNLYDVRATYLFRRTPAFWADMGIAFANEAGVLQGINPGEFYAVYRGVIMPAINGVKFVRLEPDSISKTVFPALA